MKLSRSILRAVGALWFAAVLLILLLVAMACATVVESTKGTETALVEFYGAWWFKGLLTLLAINVLAAMLLRYPFSKWHVGFVLTHCGILVTFAGAAVTNLWGVEGRVSLAEGQKKDTFTTWEDVLTVESRDDGQEATMDLTGRAFSGLKVAERPSGRALSVGNLTIEVQRYLPDSARVEDVTNDAPHPRPAVEVSLSFEGIENPVWIFTGQTADLGHLRASFRQIADQEEFRHLLHPETPDQAPSKGTIRVVCRGETFELAMEECTDGPAPLGDTGYTVRVLRYLPHAMVGQGGQLVSASDRPENPAVEVEFVGPAGSEKRLAFARFPEFGAMHGKKQLKDLELTFIAGQETALRTPVEIMMGPEGTVHARFNPEGGAASVRDLGPGRPVDTPWPERTLTVLRHFDHARVDRLLEPVEPVRETRMPALLLSIAGPESDTTMWVQKHIPEAIEGTPYEVVYGQKELPLGFALRLDHFELGRYPGTTRPRSFESHVTIRAPDADGEQSRIISMNNPTEYAGYSLFQSNYNVGRGPTVSILSVSRDPGLPVVFAGYIITMVGMTVVLITRMIERRRRSHLGQTIREPAAREAQTRGQSNPATRADALLPGGDADAGFGERTRTATEAQPAVRSREVGA